MDEGDGSDSEGEGDVLFCLPFLFFAHLPTCELQSRRSRCRYPRHVGDTSDGKLCHGVTVAVQDLPARGVAVDARESDDSVALDAVRREVRHFG